MSRSPRFIALGLCFGVTVLGAGSASAEPTPRAVAESEASSPPQAGSEANEEALLVEVLLSGTTLDEARIVAALAAELRVPVRDVDQGARLRLELAGTSLDASYGEPEDHPVARHIALPTDEAQQLELIVLLAANLVRDEAHDLIERLRQSEASDKVSPSPVPPATPSEVSKAEARPPAVQPQVEAAPRPRVSRPGRRPLMPVSLTLWSPISTDPRLASHEANFDLGVLYSEMGALRGMAVTAGIQRLTDGGRGFRVAGLGGMSGPFRGMNVSGIYGIGDGGRGFSVAGIYLRERAPYSGLTVSLVNVASDARQRGPDSFSSGAMIGLVNVGASLRGAQIGLVNVQTGTLHGVQIGLVNVSRAQHGAAIGLVNAGPTVRVQGIAWASMNPELDNPKRQEGAMVHLGVKYRIQRFFSWIGFGLAAEAEGCGSQPNCSTKDVLFAPAFGAGYRFPLASRFALEVDGVYQFEFSPRGAANVHNTLAARASAVWDLTPRVAFFAGGGPRVLTPSQDFEQTFVGPTFHAGIQLF